MLDHINALTNETLLQNVTVKIKSKLHLTVLNRLIALYKCELLIEMEKEKKKKEKACIIVGLGCKQLLTHQ